MNELLSASADADWESIAPHLDAGLDELDASDRDAVMLRYFEKKSAHEMAAQLGISDDAAQKRVSRAVERLREFFAKRGLTIGASGLAVVISANAVQAAPVGLALIVSTAAVLTGATLATTASATATKAIAMTALQKTIVTATIAILAGSGIYEVRHASQLRDQLQMLKQQQAPLAEKLQQLQDERDEANKRLESFLTKPLPQLPAPKMQADSSSLQSPVVDLPSSNLMVRLLNGETPKLTSAQIEAYLQENGRSASSLLASSRATGDKAYLAEAMEKFPNDPRVAFDAVFKSDSPEERRHWLENFKKAAPDNAMTSYLSALDYFKSGQNDQAVQELIAASNKSQFQDYSWDFVQNAEEAWRSAGYSEAETRMVATWELLLPHAAALNQLHRNIMELANAYRQAGDETSAQAALQFNLGLGQQLDGSPNDPLINQLIGIGIQRHALGAMDPNQPYGTSRLTVAEQIKQLTQQDAAIKALVGQMETLQHTMSAQEWITYNDRTRAFGEVNALQWLTNKRAGK